MEAFLQDANNEKFGKFFRDFHITLVCDDTDLDGAQQAAFDGYVSRGKLTQVSWSNFLLRTELVHQEFMAEAGKQMRQTSAD